MDAKTTARIKVNSRLKPAKDIHVAFTDLISSTNPDDFPEFKQKFILAIDSAEVEFKILQDELVTMESLVNKWNIEIEKCGSQISLLDDENMTLQHEKEEIEREIQKVDKLNEMKSVIKSEKIYDKIISTEKIEKENQKTREEIQKIEGTNEIRKVGLQQIVDGFEKFLLKKREPPATEEDYKSNEDEERYNEENEEKYDEENSENNEDNNDN